MIKESAYEKRSPNEIIIELKNEYVDLKNVRSFGVRRNKKIDVIEKANDLKSTINFQMKKALYFSVAMGNISMSEDELMQNNFFSLVSIQFDF